jgi:hypothetical protein
VFITKRFKGVPNPTIPSRGVLDIFPIPGPHALFKELGRIMPRHGNGLRKPLLKEILPRKITSAISTIIAKELGRIMPRHGNGMRKPPLEEMLPPKLASVISTIMVDWVQKIMLGHGNG